MKRIIACVKDNEYLLRLKSFCQEEKLGLTTISSIKDIDEEPYIVIITDEKELFSKENIDNSRICFITNDKMENGVYSLKENFTHAHLRMLIDVIYHGILLSNYAPSLKPYVFHKEYIISNDFYNIDRLVYAMTAELIIFFKFFELEKIRVGISEMLTNSIEHGNLGITADEKFKATEEGTYYELLNTRLNDPEISKKKTHINIDYRDRKLTVKIKDEGKGFDTSKLPDPTDSEHLLKLHGRGIFITRMYFTEIKYNSIGNEVTLIKDVPENSLGY